MTTITLPIVTCEHCYCVEAEIIDIAPHLAHIATFAIDYRLFGKWVVTHVESGYMVAGEIAWHGDEQALMRVLTNAHAKLSSMTPEMFEERCIAAVRDHVELLTWGVQ